MKRKLLTLAVLLGMLLAEISASDTVKAQALNCQECPSNYCACMTDCVNGGPPGCAAGCGHAYFQCRCNYCVILSCGRVDPPYCGS